ncbi:uncharacterized protein LOC133815794 [Humulus lupulus]|uniref:uncharacterized protein LOC133815794 n=1 Tax=Humulus lupulus TaxID=3486 RepID=UPI002B41662D|nr:uncharacterized protein LOC133815794 [Humulus lupulus]
MESNRKRRGFMKGKLMPFYRASKPSSNNNNSMQYMTMSSSTTKVVNKPNQSSPSAASVGFLVHQDYLIAQPKPKVSFVLPAAHHDYGGGGGRDSSVVQRESLYGGVTVDEGVDSKAANYISMVQERFKLERVNSERMIKCQDKS